MPVKKSSTPVSKKPAPKKVTSKVLWNAGEAPEIPSVRAAKAAEARRREVAAEKEAAEAAHISKVNALKDQRAQLLRKAQDDVDAIWRKYHEDCRKLK